MSQFTPSGPPLTLSELVVADPNRRPRPFDKAVPMYFDGHGTPILHQETSYFKALGASLAMGPLYNKSANTATRLFLNSGAEWVSSRDLGQIKLPIEVDGNGMIITPEGPKAPSGDSFYQGLHPLHQDLLARHGVSESVFKDLSFSEAADKYQFLVTDMNLKSVVDTYTDGRFNLGLTAGSMGSMLLTDPTAWAIALTTMGTGAIGEGLAKASSVQWLRYAAGLAGREGISRSFEGAISRQILLHGSNFTYGAVDATLRQYANNKTLHEYMQAAPQGIDFSESMIGGTAGLALGAVFMGAFEGLGKAAKFTHDNLRSVVSTSSSPGPAALWATRRGLYLRNFMADLTHEFDGMDKVAAVTDMIYVQYGEYGVELFQEAISKGHYDNNTQIDNLLNRLMNLPSDDEFLTEMIGESSMIRTDLEKKLDDLLILQDRMTKADVNVEEFQRLKRKETKLQKSIEEDRANIVDRMEQIKNDTHSRAVVNDRVYQVLDLIKDDLGARPQINTGRISTSAQAKVFDLLVQGDWARNWRANIGTLARLGEATKIGKLLTSASELGTGKGHVRAAEEMAPVHTALAQLVDPWGLHMSSIDPTKGTAPSLQTQFIRGRRKANKEVIAVWDRLRQDIPKSDHAQYMIKALQVAGDAATTNDPKIREMADAWRNYFDSMGMKGLKNGALASYIENYIPIYVDSTMAQRAGGAPYLSKKLYEYYLDQFAGDGVDELHMKTWWDILDNEHVRDRFSSKYSKQDYEALYAMIRSKTDLKALDEDLFGLYMDSLKDPRGRLARDAEHSIRKRLGEDARDLHEISSEGGAFDPAPRLLPDERRVRKIEQQFWLQDEFLNSSVVTYEPSSVLAQYINRGGFRIFEQDSINAITGSNTISWAGIEKWLENSVTKNPELRPVVDYILLRHDQIRGVSRLRTPDGLGAVFEPVAQTLAAGVQAGVGLAAGAVEFPLAFITQVFTPGQMSSFIRMILKDTTKEHMESFGRTFAKIRRQQRFIPDYKMMAGADFGYSVGERLKHALRRPFMTMMDPERFPSANPSKNRALQTLTSATESMSEIGHILGGEEAVTDYIRLWAYTHSFVKFKKNHERLLRFAELVKQSPISDDPKVAAKEFKALARQSGFSDPTELTTYIEAFGNRWDQNIKVIKDLKDSGFTGWKNLEEFQKVAMNAQDPEQARLLNELTDSLIDAADLDVRFASPEATVSDLMLDNTNSFGRMAMMFTSFNRAFASKKLSRLMNSPLTRTIPYLTLNVLLEASLMNFRAILYGGMSAEEVSKRWQDNPEGMMALSLARVPWVGPWTDMSMGVISDLTNEHAYNAFGTTMVGDMVNSFIGLSRKGAQWVTGDEEVELSPKERKAIDRYLPIWNLPYSRFIERSLQRFESKNEE